MPVTVGRAGPRLAPGGRFGATLAAGDRRLLDATFERSEREARACVEALGIDVGSFAAVSNIFRVANAVRNHTERNLLSEFNLSFSGFTVLWVLWVWGSRESYVLAEESGISRSTLTGVVKTLERLGFAARKPHAKDGRRVLVQATRKGLSVMREIFPRFNEVEAMVTRDLSSEEKDRLTRTLRVMLHTMEG